MTTPGLSPDAYDIVLADDGTDGWAFGRPAGITLAQWPRSRVSGLPMTYLFTVRVPVEYRCAGPDRVALAVFQADDHVADEGPGVADVFAGRRPAGAAGSPLVAAVTAYVGQRHPAEQYALDEIDGGWAMLWLAEADLTGPRCELPADYTWAWKHPQPEGPSLSPDTQPARALKLVRREGDPNVGRRMSDDPASGYVRKHTPAWTELDPPRFAGCHFGGTVEYFNGGLPDFDLRYLEFDEELGWPNLGGGSALIDLPTSRIDFTS